MSSRRFHSARHGLCALLLASGPAAALAAPPDPAALFDEGVRKFKQADYEGAAESFLRADEAAPSVQALLNAIGAGRRGHAHLLVARASQRALQRPGSTEDLSRLAREALAEAAAHLARVDLSCAPVAAADPPACALSIDGAKAEGGVHYVLPGTHRFAGAVTGGAPDEQPLTCNAGATYTVALRPALPSTSAPSASAIVVAPPTAQPGWPPAVVYAGAGVTAVLTGLAVGSGVDAIEAKNALPAVPLRAQNDDVRARASRTNGLVAGAVIAGVATAAAAVWLVSWDRAGGVKTQVGVEPSAAGVSVMVQGRF
jgi:hypothetical protein